MTSDISNYSAVELSLEYKLYFGGGTWAAVDQSFDLEGEIYL
jgi:hypothetical protein